MKKMIIYFIFSMLMLSCVSASNSDAIIYAAERSMGYMETANVITPYAEQTEWRYRLVDGKAEKRLWSITYGKWLTNWKPA